jgi:primosomal protein N' (replication factor Y)
LSHHYCFKALKDGNNEFFYDEELKARHQLKFPPFRHFCGLKIRGKSEPKVAQVCDQLFQKLSQAKSPKGVQVISANPADPAKLRGNYYWVILIRASNVLVLNSFLKINLKNFRHSGIIVTVDVDPV